MKLNTGVLSGVLAICLMWASCSVFRNNENVVDRTILKDGAYELRVDLTNFQLQINSDKGEVIVPQDPFSGLYINEEKVVEARLLSTSSEKKKFEVNTGKDKAMVVVAFKSGIIKITVVPESPSKNKVSLRFGGMSVAHGLGDAGAFGESFNLVGKEPKEFKIENNGGSKRWLSTFTVFPENEFAGVCFDRGTKSIVLGKNAYRLNTDFEGTSTFYFFTGNLKEIYANYKNLRNELGYEDVKPKSRLFELGWESWDALGWNTNQETVKDILTKFQREGYPIRWAITGSGFWDEGGTTTSFGRFGKKFPNPKKFRSWLHENDIYWMIGLRTNLIPPGGPFYPVTKKRDKNLKVSSFYGNPMSTEAIGKNILLSDSNNIPIKMTSGIFPIVPCFLIDGNKQGAATWFEKKFKMWGVDGIKEDTMMDLEEETSIFNQPIAEIAMKGSLVMARSGEFSSPGTLLRINDTGVQDMQKRTPINYMQYAACGFPNVYSDVAGVHNMYNVNELEASIRHAWMLSLTSGMAVGAFPSKWPEEKQEIFKKTIDFHFALGPYLFSSAMKTYKSGFPYTLTPMGLAFPKDKATHELGTFQWMIGESILTTPLLKNYKNGRKTVYLPEGIWFDWQGGRKFTGPLLIENYEIPIDKIPCFVGGDGIVVLREKQTFKVRVYAVGKKATAEFFTLNEGKKYHVQVSNLNQNALSVWNKQTKEIVHHIKKAGFVEFNIVEGQDYELR